MFSSQFSSPHLQKISIVVVVDENLELLQLCNVLLHLHLGPGQALPQLIVVGRGNVEELGATLAKVSHGREDVVGAQRNVLHAGRAVVVDVLLDLRLALSGRRLVDGHLYGLLPVGHDDGAQGRVVGGQLLVVHAPETMEQQIVLVPGEENKSMRYKVNT